ncbi:MAG: penicillin-binding protein 1A [Gammaproteobacteria bacterium]|nr:penicillin-binding protein 1A [Gammaproteobacteria bacterium]NIR82230.1 penicillin-binding protein 1A [Gammaproteobacteria bacterium]NIR90829.1 penicillin-binding protein 1A [Gammaproteobacteria bacterium]NIU03380.1 penicillin-binding protein 1A [Gammaproteobacteria bacterium]NIV50876.1 PBP1A family penicillin-binding protein [Gammaproteobacteria bacterium]
MSKVARVLFGLTLVGGLIGLLVASGVVAYLVPRLPSIESLKDVQLQVPLRVYTRDERLIAEFGEKRRRPVQLAEVPDTMIKAVLAAEDEHFYQHPGVDVEGLARAVWYLVRTGEKGPGGSTITMQVARNFFLGREKTYLRKLNEILLALKIERGLSKDEILELYLNKIFLGQRAYGVAAAAQVYYGAKLNDLTLPEVAMIAGLPKAPSRFNPIANPTRAVERRGYVLGRMHELEFIDDESYRAAVNAPVTARLHALSVEVEAPYVAEMVRAEMEAREGAEAYTRGLRVHTTIDSRLQRLANQALRVGLVDYDRRHGYRGPVAQVTLPENPEDTAALDALLAEHRVIGGLVPAIVLAVSEKQATVYGRGGVGEITLPWEALSWARPHISENRLGPEPKAAGDILAPGEVVHIERRADKWLLAQLPEVEGALVALDPDEGSIRALTGGFDFRHSKFNRAVQAERQPGSSFKPFIYSAALERGFTAASFINDAPVVFDDPGLEATWRPENYSGRFFGPTRLREALFKSRNLVSIRLLRSVGIDFAVDYLRRFGFDPGRLPHNLSLALGSGTVTPVELARGYAVFANGGYRVDPYFIERVEEGEELVTLRAQPVRVCWSCAGALHRVSAGGGRAEHGPRTFRTPPRVLTRQNAWLMNSFLRDVIKRGTGRRARQLGRSDLAGKTGTTNDQRDAWFSGFNPSLVATAWVGFDKLQPLGRRETGARAALPIWMEFMRGALQGVPKQHLEQPEGLVTVRIDPETGALASAGDPDAIFETFRVDHVPRRLAEAPAQSSSSPSPDEGGVTPQLF